MRLFIASLILLCCESITAQTGSELAEYGVHTTWDEQHAKVYHASNKPNQNPMPQPLSVGDTTLLGTTTYDLQTNNSVCRRIIDHGNDQLAATWNISHSFNIASQDRGTGYNYYNGNAWQIPSTNQTRIENQRSGWPTIGSTGDREFVVTHSNNQPGLNFAYRNQIGSGSWQHKTIPNDPDATWPRAANMGDTIFVITSRFSGQGQPAATFNGVEGGLALHRSWDGGNTWTGPDTIEGLNQNNFGQIGGDTYAIDANEESGVVALVTGFPRPTFFKSTDYGDTWQMHPLIDVANPTYTGSMGETIDSTVTSDESYSIIVDDNGQVHVFYGREVIIDDDPSQAGWTFYPINAGIMYWNEYMGMNHDPKRIWETAPAAEQLVFCEWLLPQGASQDWASAYFQNIVSMPQAGTDQNGNIYLSYAGMRSGIFDQQGNPLNLSPSGLLYRNTFLIKSTNKGQDWKGPVNVNQDSTEEAVYASIPRHIKGDSIPVLYQADSYPGIAVQDQSPGNNGNSFILNDIVVTNIHKNNITTPPDITCPTITISTDTSLFYASCTDQLSFDDSLLATDVPEGIINDEIEVIDSLTSTTPGHVQNLQYYVTDGAGNSSDTVQQTVKIIADTQDTIAPQVSLIGLDTIDVVINTSYNDQGANVTDPEGCLDTVMTISTVDTSTTGTYTYAHVAEDVGGNRDTAQRTVNVISQDTIDPVINLNGNNPITLSACEGEYQEPGATAVDNTGNLTDSISINGSVNDTMVGTYSVTYTVTDEYGNGDTVTRMILVEDQNAPALQLKGNDPMYICTGNTYNEPGATTYDCVEGNLDSQINIANSSVDTSAPGSYTVSYAVSDSAGNAATASREVIVNQPNANGTIQPEICGNDNGVIQLSATGSSIPYTYSWNTGQSGSSLTGLSQGQYWVTITNYDGCTRIDTHVVSSNTITLNITTSTSNASCNNADGSMSASVSNGNSPYNFQWSNGATGGYVNNISSGNYTVTATDVNGCTGTETAIVHAQGAPTLNITKSDISCYGDDDGEVFVSATGSTTPYSYSWSTGDDTAFVSDLSAGTYSVTVTGGNNCSSTATVNIQQPDSLHVSASSDSASCYGLADGRAYADAGGGVPPYQYTWSNNQMGDTITGMNAGLFSVTIIDNNGCIQTDSVIVDEPPALNVDTNAITHNTGQSNGSIDLSVNGGNPPYIYSWSNGDTTQDISGLSEGQYVVTVTDANNCDKTLTLMIEKDVGIGSASSTKNFAIFPNPTSGNITLQLNLPNTSDLVIELYDIRGQTFMKKEVPNRKNYKQEFDMSDRTDGVYFLKVTSAEESIVEKVMVQ